MFDPGTVKLPEIFPRKLPIKYALVVILPPALICPLVKALPVLVLPDTHQHLIKYQAEKLILKEMSQRISGTCNVKYKWFAYVGTEAILKKYPHFTENDYITEDQAVDIILSC